MRVIAINRAADRSGPQFDQRLTKIALFDGQSAAPIVGWAATMCISGLTNWMALRSVRHRYMMCVPRAEERPGPALALRSSVCWAPASVIHGRGGGRVRVNAYLMSAALRDMRGAAAPEMSWVSIAGELGLAHA